MFNVVKTLENPFDVQRRMYHYAQQKKNKFETKWRLTKQVK